MIGPILIVASWILLRLEGKGLSSLGFNAPVRRLGQFIAGFVVCGLAATLQQFAYASANDTTWVLNPAANGATLRECLRLILNSVLFEEFVFHGYLLFQLIRFIGATRAVIVNAAAFGIYHWFSYQAFGNPWAMLFIFLFTGMFGAMCALAFAKTRSVAAPIGLHLGWNVITYAVFSAGPSGRVLFVPTNGEPQLQAGGWAGLLIGVGLPIAMATIIITYLLRQKGDDAPDDVVQKPLGRKPQ